MCAECSRDGIKAHQQHRSVDEEALGGRAEDPDSVAEKPEGGVDEPEAQAGGAPTTRNPIEVPAQDTHRPNSPDYENDGQCLRPPRAPIVSELNVNQVSDHWA